MGDGGVGKLGGELRVGQVRFNLPLPIRYILFSDSLAAFRLCVKASMLAASNVGQVFRNYTKAEMYVTAYCTMCLTGHN
eukprot:4119678-Pleurochrysis_carterae.AAC.1